MEEQARLIEEDPDYGEVICRCEKVTKAVFLKAIHNPLGSGYHDRHQIQDTFHDGALSGRLLPDADRAAPSNRSWVNKKPRCSMSGKVHRYCSERFGRCRIWDS